MNLAALRSLVAQGESETLDLKRSTAELRRAGETLCAFLNGGGGKVLIGVGPNGRLVGQEVADITLRDVVAMLGRFEPPARVEMSRVDVGNGRQVIDLDAAPSRQFAPFVYESRPYKRVDVGDILDRLGLHVDGEVTQAAQMLYGTKFLPGYTQALLKLGRFRGTKIADSGHVPSQVGPKCGPIFNCLKSLA